MSDDGTPLFAGTDILRVLNFAGSAITSISDQGGGEALVTIDKADTPNTPTAPTGSDPAQYVLNVPPAGEGDPTWESTDGAISLAGLSDTDIPDSITTNHVLGFNGTNWTPREDENTDTLACLLYTSPSPRDRQKSRMPSSA